VADAVADPCAGLVAAAATLAALAAGGSWLLDVSLRRVAAHLAGPGPGPGPGGGRDPRPGPIAGPPPGLVAEPPRARRPSGPAPRLGEHTGAVLAGLGAG
jgi:hypothetical protein